jgi:DNA-binding NarL/FixJ family response regulator
MPAQPTTVVVTRPRRDPVRVIVLDDHPAMRAGLQAIIAPHADLRLLGLAADERELWPMMEATHPTVVVLDIHHPGRSGLDMTLRITRVHDAPRVVVYAAYTPPELIVAASVAGAAAVVNKASPPATLLEALRCVEPAAIGLARIPRGIQVAAAARLDPSDHAVLAMRLAGHRADEIANTLGITEQAVYGRISAVVAQLEREAELQMASHVRVERPPRRGGRRRSPTPSGLRALQFSPAQMRARPG